MMLLLQLSLVVIAADPVDTAASGEAVADKEVVVDIFLVAVAVGVVVMVVVCDMRGGAEIDPRLIVTAALQANAAAGSDGENDNDGHRW